MARPKSDKTLNKQTDKQKIAAELKDPETQALDAEERRSRLKTLIVLGKERRSSASSAWVSGSFSSAAIFCLSVCLFSVLSDFGLAMYYLISNSCI